MRRQALNVFRMRLMGAEGRPGDERHAHAQGRDQRGDSRLGHERRGHALHHRLGRRAGAVSAHGARLPVGDRPRGARADAGARGPAARDRRRLRRRRLQRDGHLPRVRGRREVELVGRGSGGRGLEPSATPRRSRAGRRACCTARCSYLLQDADGQVHPAHSISAGLDYPGVGPEHAYLKDCGRATYVGGDRRRGARRLRRCSAASRESSPHWRPPTPWPGSPRSAGGGPDDAGAPLRQRARRQGRGAGERDAPTARLT